MTDSRVSNATPSGSPVDVDAEFDRILTEGLHQAVAGRDLGKARLASHPSGAVVPSGTVLPMMTGELTDEEREKLFRALEN